MLIDGVPELALELHVIQELIVGSVIFLTNPDQFLVLHKDSELHPLVIIRMEPSQADRPLIDIFSVPWLLSIWAVSQLA